MRKLFELALAAAFVLASQSEALAIAVPAMRPMPYAPPPRLALSAFPPRQLPAVQLTGDETRHQARLSPMWVHAARLAMAAALRAAWLGPTVRVRRGNVTNLAFNSVNQLTRVDLPDGTRSSYKYDAAGRRVEKSTGSTSNPAVTRFIYDGQNILAALDGNNNLLALFTQGPGIDQPLIMRKPDGTKFFMLADALGSVVAHADESGAVVERVAYEAYGKPVFVDVRGPPAVASESLTGAPFAFTGRTWENETGFFDYRFRQVYDPRMGRFGQEDPQGLGGGDINLYAYARFSPVLFIDPLGLEIMEPYPGLDEAIIAALEQYLGYSVTLGREIGGAIYVDAQGRYYYATPFIGDAVGVKLGGFWVPPGMTVAGLYHTHVGEDIDAIHDGMNWNERFSDPDRYAAWATEVPMGLGTPYGFIYKYTPPGIFGSPRKSGRVDVLKVGRKGSVSPKGNKSQGGEGLCR